MAYMRKKFDQKDIDALRERLYSRGNPPRKRASTKLTEQQHDVATDWEDTPVSSEPKVAPKQNEPVEDMESADEVPQMDAMGKRRKSYRKTLLVTAVSFFGAAVVLSSLFILFGGNSISSANIAVSINGPFTVGGGEELPIQVGITNENNVPIESATLIVEYPRGTQAVDENEELFIERIPLDTIRSGETVNVPLRARVFGEENDELEVKVSVEYRVAGSNATFFKEAQPLRFKITTSPVSLDLDAVETIASGQEFTVTLAVQSNASAPLSNLLVQAEYPAGFDFTSSSPNPASGQNTWRIEDLEPEGTAEIEITGVMTGTESETQILRFSVGVPNERDPYTLASAFSTASSEISIEHPFMEVNLSVNGTEGDLAIAPGQASNVSVTIRNTLDDAVYNAEVRVQLSGNALSDLEIRPSNGFYDSNTQMVIWDSSSRSDLTEILPGTTEELRFTITPKADSIRTPRLDLAASVRARRVRESSVSEALLGSAAATLRVESAVILTGETARDDAGFTDTGPVPPVVGETTSYTIVVRAEGGGNDVSDAVVTATLPTYVTWVGTTAGHGSISYSGPNRTVTWKAGDISAGSAAEASFQVTIAPSASQTNTTPTLVSEQRLRAEDRFTGSVVRATSPALTTRVTSDEANSGRVQPQE